MSSKQAAFWRVDKTRLYRTRQNLLFEHISTDGVLLLDGGERDYFPNLPYGYIFMGAQTTVHNTCLSPNKIWLAHTSVNHLLFMKKKQIG